MQTSLFRTPVAPAPVLARRHEARWYQREAIREILSGFGKVRSLLLVMATGTGKTFTFSQLIAELPGRVLVLAHRYDLIEQARETLERMLGEAVGVEQADRYSTDERVVVGSVQSCRPGRLEQLEIKGGFRWIVVDESHHAAAPSYLRILSHFKDAKVLGVTATPNRSDEKALGKVFDDVAYTYDLESAIDDGFLVPFKGVTVDVKEVDLSGVGTVAGDLNQGQLDEVMAKSVEGIVSGVMERAPNGRGPIFLPGKHSATYCCERLNALKPGCAMLVTDDTEFDERLRIRKAMKARSFQWLVNVMVATEGLDWPDADTVVLARPTKSRSLFAQMVGRGSRTVDGCVDDLIEQHQAEERRERIAQSRKPWCTILDFVGNPGFHKLASVEDILGGNYTEDEVEHAKKLRKANPDRPALQALKDARAELKAAALALKAKTSLAYGAFDVFNVLEVDRGKAGDIDRRFGWSPCTDPQAEALLKLGFSREDVKQTSKRTAAALITKAKERRSRGLATPKQLRILQTYGYTDPDLLMARAGEAMTYLSGLNWNRKAVDHNKLDQIVLGQRQPGED